MLGVALFRVVFAGRANAEGGPENVFYGVPSPPGPFWNPSSGGILPQPSHVPSKNFSINQNTHFAGNLEMGHSQAWDGLGGSKDLNIHTDPSGTTVEMNALADREEALCSAIGSDSYVIHR